MIGSACAYLLDNLSHVAFVDKQSRPACMFGTIFMSIMARACALTSSHLTNLLTLVTVGFDIVPEMYSHSLNPFKYGMIHVFQKVQFNPSSFKHSDLL